MCGYCIEGGIVLDFIEHEQSESESEDESRFLADELFLLESYDYLGAMTKMQNSINFSRLIDVVFCRVWETLVNEEYYGALQRVSVLFGADTINKFLSKIKGNHNHSSWNLLGNSKLYFDKSKWEIFINNKELLIRNSENTLASYYRWWIQGENKKTSDPTQRMEETGIMDPIDNTIPKEWDKFYSSFPFVYFSLLFLLKHQDNSDIIKRIALEDPNDVPDFLGYDLYLQRKAFAACVKKYGVSFIIENYDDIRLELIYYALLKKSICNKDAAVLRVHLLSHSHWSMGISTDEVLQFIAIQNQQRQKPGQTTFVWF